MARSYKGIRLKKHRVYSVDDLMEAYGVTRNTVSNWVRAGLEPSVSGRRNLFRGATVEEFHRARRERSKTELRPGEFKCMSCKMAVVPDEVTVAEWTTRTGTVGSEAVCPECEARVFKITRSKKYDVDSQLHDPNTTGPCPHEENGSDPGRIGIESEIHHSPNDAVIYLWQDYAGKFSGKTLDRHLTSIRQFEEFTGFKAFEALTLKDVHDLRDHLKASLLPDASEAKSKSAVSQTVSRLKDFLLWLRKQDGFKRLPADLPDALELPRAAYAKSLARESRLYPSLDEAHVLLESMPRTTIVQRRARAVFALSFLGALRADTLVSLRLKDIDLRARTITQDGQFARTKNGKSLVIAWFPIPEAFSSEISEWVEIMNQGGFDPNDTLFPPEPAFDGRRKARKLLGQRVPAMTSTYAVQEAFKVACQGHHSTYSPHAAKHTIAAERDQRPLNAEQRKAWSANMGHEDARVTDRHYGQISEARRLKLMSQVGDATSGQIDLVLSDDEKIALFDQFIASLRSG